MECYTDADLFLPHGGFVQPVGQADAPIGTPLTFALELAKKRMRVVGLVRCQHLLACKLKVRIRLPHVTCFC